VRERQGRKEKGEQTDRRTESERECAHAQVSKQESESAHESEQRKKVAATVFFYYESL